MINSQSTKPSASRILPIFCLAITVVSFALALNLGWQIGQFLAVNGSLSPTLAKTDILQDYLLGLAYQKGIEPYQGLSLLAQNLGQGVEFFPQTSPHPPLNVLLFWPLSYLSFLEVRISWAILTVMGLFAGVQFLFSSLMWTRELNSVSRATIFTLFFLSMPVRYEILTGNINWIVFSLLCFFWYLISTNRLRLAGAVLGLAFHVKLVGVWILAQFLRQKCSRMITSFIATASLIVAVLLVMMSVTSFQNWRSGVKGNLRFWLAAQANLSIAAPLVRWKSDIPPYHMGENEFQADFEGIDPSLATASLLPSVLLAVCITLISLQRLILYDLKFASGVVVSWLTWPLVWPAQTLMLFIPILIICGYRNVLTLLQKGLLFALTLLVWCSGLNSLAFRTSALQSFEWSKQSANILPFVFLLFSLYLFKLLISIQSQVQGDAACLSKRQ